MIRDPESACAASICYLARTNRTMTLPLEGRHPRPCEWCAYGPSDLLRMVTDYNSADVDGHLSAKFRRLSPNAQGTLVDAALYGVTS